MKLGITKSIPPCMADSFESIGRMPAVDAESLRLQEKADSAEVGRQMAEVLDKKIQSSKPEYSQKELARLWEQLKNRDASSSYTLGQEIRELSKLYQSLLSAILTQVLQEEKAGRLTLLEQYLGAALQRIMDCHTPSLSGCFIRFQTGDALQTLRNSLYYAVTGHTLTAEEAGEVWDAVTRTVQKSCFTRTFSPDPPSGRPHPDAAGSYAARRGHARSEQGIIYHPGSSGSEKILKEKADTAGMYQRWEPGSETGRSGISSRTSGTLYSLSDIEKGEQFVRYLDKNADMANTDGRSGFTAGNSELTGTLAAIVSIKADIFANYSGVSRMMGLTVKSAADRMADYYISEAAAGRLAVRHPQQRYYVDGSLHYQTYRKSAYQVYDYTMSLFIRYKDPGTALGEGLRYALSLFGSRQEQGQGRDNMYYEENAGFFFAGRRKKGTDEMQEGKKLIKRDWNTFLHAVHQEDNKNLMLELEKNSVWGIDLAPAPVNMWNQKANRVIAAVVIFAAALAILAVCFV